MKVSAAFEGIKTWLPFFFPSLPLLACSFLLVYVIYSDAAQLRSGWVHPFAITTLFFPIITMIYFKNILLVSTVTNLPKLCILSFSYCLICVLSLFAIYFSTLFLPICFKSLFLSTPSLVPCSLHLVFSIPYLTAPPSSAINCFRFSKIFSSEHLKFISQTSRPEAELFENQNKLELVKACREGQACFLI